MKTIFAVALLLFVVSCSSKQSGGEAPSLSGACGYTTRNEIEEALGVSLAGEPAEINEVYLGGRGCSFAGQNESTQAHFGYIIFPGAPEFEKAKQGSAVSGVGDEAYTVNGADAEQLWVREGDRYVMVAIGDVPRPDESKKLAKLVLERLKTKPLN